MSKYTIKTDEAKRIQKIDTNERIIIFDDIELDQVDEDGNNLGISFTVFQEYKEKVDTSDIDLPPSTEVLYHHVGVGHLKMINGASETVLLSQSEREAISKDIINLIKFQ